ncbi:MAG: PKD domain-containing protein [Bacteroidales bacterium]
MKALALKSIAIIAAVVLGIVSCNPDEIIYHTAPEPLFDVSATEVERGDDIQFTDKSKPVEGVSVVAWAWNFDAKNSTSTATSTEQNPTYAYMEVGVFTVRLTVTDSQGSKASVEKEITVNIPNTEIAHAEFLLPEGRITTYTEVQFTDASLPAAGETITSWAWNFGVDGNSVSTEQNPTYTYTKSGSYTVSLTVVDSKGNTSAKSRDINVIAADEKINLLSTPKEILGSANIAISPAMSPDGSTVYMWAQALGDTKASLKAFEVATGTQKWVFDVTAALQGLGYPTSATAGASHLQASPSVGANGDIYLMVRDLVNASDNRTGMFLLAVKASGTLNWHYQIGGSKVNNSFITPAIDATGNIYAGPRESNIPVVSKDGALVSTLNIVAGGVSGTVILDNSGNLFMRSFATIGIYGYNIASGTLLGSHTGHTPAAADAGMSMDASGIIYASVSGAPGRIVALNKSLTEQWTFPIPGATTYGGTVLGADGTVYASGGTAVAGTESAGVYALDPTTGAQKWHYATEENVSNTIPLVDNRGYIHFITDAGTYHVVTNEGAKYDSKQLDGTAIGSPVMNDKGQVCVVTLKEDKTYMNFLTIEETTSYNTTSAWPMKGQNPQRTHLQK